MQKHSKTIETNKAPSQMHSKHKEHIREKSINLPVVSSILYVATPLP